MTVALFAALVLQVTDFARELAGGKASRSSVVTQVAAWAVGILFVWVGGVAAVTKALVPPGISMSLGQLDGGSVVLVGLLWSSLASTAVDFKQAFDDKDSAAKPRLLKP